MQAIRHLLPLPNGSRVEIFLPNDGSDDVAESIAQGKYTIPPHYRLLESLLRRPGRVVDLGTHLGTFALYAAALGHEVIAVDASERNAAILRDCCKFNGFDRVNVIHAAITDSPGQVEFTELGPYGVVANPLLNWPTVPVAATTVDALLADFGWPDADFVKMDIEGSEVAALRGMRRLVSDTQVPIVFESNGHTLHFYDQSPNMLLRYLEQASYATWEVRDHRLVPVASTDLQFECVVDYLALKGSSHKIDGWRFDARRSERGQIEMAIATCRHSNANVRAHAGRMLQFADASTLSDIGIQTALQDLAKDLDEKVRESVRWFIAR